MFDSDHGGFESSLTLASHYRDQNVKVAVTVGFESSTGEGAVLITNGDVVRNMATPKDNLYDWVDDNLEQLAKIRGVRERGL